MERWLAGVCVLSVVSSVQGSLEGHTTDAILGQCAKQVDEGEPKRFNGETIGFVTPWHPEGKKNALRYAGKFTYISPLWFHIEPEDISSEDVSKWTVRVAPASNTAGGKPDKAWAEQLQSRGVKVVPIFAFYGWTRPALAKFFMDADAGYMQHSASRQIINHYVDLNLDGLVIEWGPVPLNEYYTKLVPWLSRIKGSLAKFIERPSLLMLSVHADPTNFGVKQFESLATTVNKFVLHTYNFTSPAIASGPNAPLDWFNDMLKAWSLHKRKDAENLVLVTLNTFGKEYRQDSKLDVEGYKQAYGARDMDGELTRWDVTGRQFEALLKRSQSDPSLQLVHKWHDEFKEHYVELKVKGEPRTIYYPSLQNMKDRIDILHKASATGLGLWNLGTGMEYFFSLL
eukprot:TRINITY_DN73179_c0_g1_i1.p1 TRINITY_DN73179_c0_g1~~TRINITY_DN73179_c0_g1_i1.p1  ORF type:complete len:455 (+),score=144.84 TRINITY_DN73179_c0_g1_i1:169-1365(+)